MKRRYQYINHIHDVQLEHTGGYYQAKIDGKEYHFELLGQQAGQISLRFNDNPVTLYWAENNGVLWFSYKGCTFKLETPAPPSFHREGETAESNLLRAPMPAQVREVFVKHGDEVGQGQTLLLLEAMKMEIRLQAPHRGRVARVTISSGDQVDRDQVLIELDAGRMESDSPEAGSGGADDG